MDGVQLGLMLILGGGVWMAVRRMVLLRRCGCLVPAQRLYRRCAWGMGLGVWGMMLAQEGILLLSGQLSLRTGLPLHLCSALGVMSLPMLLSRKEWLWHTSLYLSLPGALLALLFPAIAPTPWPQLTAFTFHGMHVMVFLAPLLPLGLGMCPRPLGAAQAWLTLLLLGGAALAANMLLGSNYLFLAYPVEGTPLTLLARFGLWPYRLTLAGLAGVMLAVLAGIVYGLSLGSGHRRRM